MAFQVMKITKLNLVKTKPILYTNAHAQMNSSITRLPYAATQHHTYVRTYVHSSFQSL